MTMICSLSNALIGSMIGSFFFFVLFLQQEGTAFHIHNSNHNYYHFGRKIVSQSSASQSSSFRFQVEMVSPTITGVFLRSFDLDKARQFYGEGGLGLKTSLLEGTLKVELPSGSASIYFKEDKECILNRPTFEWEDEFSEEHFQQLLRDVEAGPYAEYITEEDRHSGFKELDMEREFINARSYSDGTAYFGVGVTLPQTTNLFDNLISKDHKIIRFPGTYYFGASLIPDEDELAQHPVKYGITADPDEYAVEVNEEPNPHTPEEKVVLCVLDAEASTEFYTNVLGFDLIRKRYNLNNRPRAASCTVYLGDKENPKKTHLELQYRYATEKLEHGVGFEKLTIAVPELNEIEAKLKSANVVYTKGTGNIQFVDLNGYQITLLKSK